MLHRPNRRPAFYAPERPRATEFIGYADVVAFLRQNVWIVAVSLLLGLVSASAYLWFSEPLFTARSQLLIDPRTPQLPREQKSETSMQLDAAQLESQIAILRSEKTAATVMSALGLDKDPEFAPPRSLPDRLGWTHIHAAGTAPAAERARRTGQFQSRLDIRRLGLSYAIEISFTSRDPEKAARIANSVAQAYLDDQFETNSQVARLGSNWLEARMGELRETMNSATRRVQEFKATHDYRIARVPIERAGSEGEPGRAAHSTSARDDNTLEELETTAEAYRKLYESFVQAFAGAADRQSFPATYARVITPATRPATKSHPRSTMVLAFGAFLGLFSGLGISFLRSRLDDRVRSPQQIRDELGLECLGEVPRLGHRSLAAMLRRTSGADSDAYFDQIAKDPLSPFTSSVQHIKTSIKLAQRSRSMRCLGVTSALPREGKTTLACNLTSLFAMSGSRTLLIDADLRNSALSKKMAPDLSAGGLIRALRNPKRARREIRSPNGTHFDFLPVRSDLILNSSDILGSEAMKALLESLDPFYDHIIFDLPPLRPAPDGIALGALLDGMIVVAEWGGTPVELLSEVTRALHKAQAPLLGVVITKVRSPQMRTYGYGNYGRRAEDAADSRSSMASVQAGVGQ
jgi:capsular exopolysaccharide synthesis family protein